MTKTQKITILISLVAGLSIIGLALVYVRQQSGQPAAKPAVLPPRTVQQVELKAADGKDGRDCLVAVDGTVYKIQDFTLWQNGQHDSSKGLAYCGADLTEAMGQSPHGRKKLDVLIKVGPLAT